MSVTLEDVNRRIAYWQQQRPSAELIDMRGSAGEDIFAFFRYLTASRHAARRVHYYKVPVCALAALADASLQWTLGVPGIEFADNLDTWEKAAEEQLALWRCHGRPYNYTRFMAAAKLLTDLHDVLNMSVVPQEYRDQVPALLAIWQLAHENCSNLHNSVKGPQHESPSA